MLYRTCEALSTLAVYFMVIFGPWAFGTTQNWAIWTMNTAGYTLGALRVFQRMTAWRKGHLYSWNLIRPPQIRSRFGFRECTPPGSVFINSLGVLTSVLLLYCFTSALNARAKFNPETASFEYYDCCRWLPHSFDSHSSWFAFWTYLALAAAFWSIRDWLLGNAPRDRCPAPAVNAIANREYNERHKSRMSPARLGRLLTLLSVNGGLLALESMTQRLAGSSKLLFLVQPQIHKTAITQFGPYAYHANAAEYFNLLWPVCLGFWWTICRTGRQRQTGQHLILICVGLMMVASLMSASKAGAAVCFSLCLISSVLLLVDSFALGKVPSLNSRRRAFATKKSPLRALAVTFHARTPVLTFLFLSLPVLGLALGWNELIQRTNSLGESLERRERIYEVARQMVKDFAPFGSGPGTYESVSEFYRPASPGFWPAQVHNDWLETRITFGWPGIILISLAFALAPLRWLSLGGLDGSTRFAILSWLALAGCLVHANFDFPFQVHSILFLFVLISAMLVTMSRKPFNCCL